jgi:AraC-like DNA-binding protein
MPSVPLSFVLSLLLIIILVRMARRADRGVTGYAFLVLMGICVVLAAIVGLRWSYDLAAARFVQPILASALPPTAWIAFGGLRQSGGRTIHTLWPHFLPIVAVAILSVVWRSPLDLALVAIFTGYGTALLWLARGGADDMGAARIGEQTAAHRSLMIVGTLLIVSGLIDLVIAIDLGSDHGTHAVTIVAIANLITIALSGYAAAIGERSRPEAEQETNQRADVDARLHANAEGSISDFSIVAVVDGMMRERKLHRDPNLTLERLARRAGIPARQISGAINRTYGRNVSQIVNEHRVEDAKRQLTDTTAPITTVMFEAGFQTKSNFNREFLRVTGMSPSDYRRLASGKIVADRAILPEVPLPER